MTNRFKLWVAILLGLGLLAILGAKWGYDRLRADLEKSRSSPQMMKQGLIDATLFDRNSCPQDERGKPKAVHLPIPAAGLPSSSKFPVVHNNPRVTRSR
jgi:hypothetical protein